MMMHFVQAPERRPGMSYPVQPVAQEIACDDLQRQLSDDRPMCRPDMQRPARGADHIDERKRREPAERKGDCNLDRDHEEAVFEIVGKTGRPFAAKWHK